MVQGDCDEKRRTYYADNDKRKLEVGRQRTMDRKQLIADTKRSFLRD